MEWNHANLGSALEAARCLLSRLGLAEYHFDLAPLQSECGIRVLYAGPDTWRDTLVCVDASELVASQEDGRIRAALLDHFRRALTQARTLGEAACAACAGA